MSYKGNLASILCIASICLKTKLRYRYANITTTTGRHKDTFALMYNNTGLPISIRRVIVKITIVYMCIG